MRPLARAHVGLRRMELVVVPKVLLLAGVLLTFSFIGPGEQLVPIGGDDAARLWPDESKGRLSLQPLAVVLSPLPPQSVVVPTLACREQLPAVLTPAHRAFSIIEHRPCNCSIFAALHLRKCAGTTMRAAVFSSNQLFHELFEPRMPNGRVRRIKVERAYCRKLADHLSAFTQQMDAADNASVAARLSGSAVSAPPREARRPLLFDWEVHCEPSLSRFSSVLAHLRARPDAARGCALFSLTVLRHPVSWLVSDFYYFVNEQDHINVSLREFAALKPEALLLDGSSTSSLGLRLPTPRTLRMGRHGAAYNASAPLQAEVNGAYARVRLANKQLREVTRDLPARQAAIAEAKARAAKGVAGRDNGTRPHDKAGSEARALAESMVDRMHGYFGRQRLAHKAVLRARAAYYGVLRARALLPCEELIARADAMLLQLDLVGIAERFDETLLLAIDGGRLQALPPAHRLNVGAARREVDAAARAELLEQNRCSIQLYERWRQRFDQLVSAQPPQFGMRLQQMRQMWEREDEVVIKVRGSVNSAPAQPDAASTSAIAVPRPAPFAKPAVAQPAPPAVALTDEQAALEWWRYAARAVAASLRTWDFLRRHLGGESFT